VAVRNERTYGKFVRTIPLPEGVKATDIASGHIRRRRAGDRRPAAGNVLRRHRPKVEVTATEEKKTVKAA
jgi:HSP20 family molecular chaperone IbpA